LDASHSKYCMSKLSSASKLSLLGKIVENDYSADLDRMEEPEERREVQIGRLIIELTKQANRDPGFNSNPRLHRYAAKIHDLALELVDMHSLGTKDREA